MSVAVLLMAHGTPSSLDQMPAYLTCVRGGRAPSDELVAEITANYAAIGGRSPLTDITLQQRNALRERLGPSSRVLVGMRNWDPLIGDVLPALAGSDVSRVVGIPLAPQYSTLSVQKYVEAATAALPAGIEFTCAPSYYAHPLLHRAYAERVREAGLPTPGEEVVFTAHALPERVVRGGDPYRDQVEATAAGVARQLGLGGWQLAFQSAGRTPEPWIGPDISEMIRARAAAGVAKLLIVPVGFVCDHTEILFDIDIQAAGVARACGVGLRRSPSLNASPTFIALLEDLVRCARLDWSGDGLPRPRA
jgi:ferrochelatase